MCRALALLVSGLPQVLPAGWTQWGPGDEAQGEWRRGWEDEQDARHNHFAAGLAWLDLTAAESKAQIQLLSATQATFCQIPSCSPVNVTAPLLRKKVVFEYTGL